VENRMEKAVGCDGVLEKKKREEKWIFGRVD